MSWKPDALQVAPLGSEYRDGELHVGSASVPALAAEYGTPLYIHDERDIEARLASCHSGLDAYPAKARVIYATKALAITAMLELVASHGLGADVASLGELELALRAGIDPALMVMHGNAKTGEQISRAIDAGVGLLVVDSPQELHTINVLASERSATQDILVRVNPDIATDTHEFIQTGHAESKFGIVPDDARDLLVRAAQLDGVNPRGFHVHLGSQLMDGAAWTAAAEWSATFAASLLEAGVAPEVLDVGGGHGIAYLPGEDPGPTEAWAREISTRIATTWTAAGVAAPQLILEPGRSIAGPGGVTAYTVVTTKSAGGQQIAAVDGGMSDNPRPMLYDATYTCLPAADPGPDSPARPWQIAGMHCESGDILINTVDIPDPQPGDVLVVPATGAYAQSMSSSYNAQLAAPVVFVRDGTARLVMRRGTVDDLVARDA